jgi:hypothetical protein
LVEKSKIWNPRWVNLKAPKRVAQALERSERMPYFCTMSHDSSHDHGHDSEPNQNEIGGPVAFALILFGLVITVIAFLA